MPQYDLVHLSYSVFITRQFVFANINGLGLFGKRADSFHILSIGAEPLPSKNIFRLVDELAFLERWYSMIVFTVDSICTAASGEEETEISSTFFVEQIGSSIANVEFWIASGECGLLFLFVFGADILGIPEVILLISFFIGVVIGKGCFHLFAGGPLLGVSEGDPLGFLFFEVLLGDVFVDVKPQLLGFGFELR